MRDQQGDGDNMNTSDGGPAFPVQPMQTSPMAYAIASTGMTLRDYFAAASLPVAWAIVEHGCKAGLFDGDDDSARTLVSVESYRIADSMLKAKEMEMEA
jgi:hypothetical protein